MSDDVGAEPFPIVCSVPSAVGLRYRLLPAYDLGDVLDCTLLQHNLNDTYLVRTVDASYALRVSQFRGRQADDVAYEVGLLTHLDRNGIAVARPVARRDGRFVTMLDMPEGPRAAVLFTFAPGEPLHAPDHDDVSSRRYGRAAALLHAASDDFTYAGARFRLDATALIDAPLVTTLPLLSHRPDDRDELAQLAERLKRRLADVPTGALAVGACHGDLTGSNASVDDDGTVTFYDFEYCGVGWRAYDLASFRWSMALGRSRMGLDDEALWTAFLAGYREGRAVNDVDLAIVPVFVAIRHLWYLGLQTANWDYWGRHEVDDAFFDRELAFLREWVVAHVDGDG
jgi:Ser/Thr protein kinase RdoA (MazF antagonist)